MPDSHANWQREASRKLENAGFSDTEREEVARELAGYLEDLNGESLASGAGESSTVSRASRELHEDPHLGANLYRARKENDMNDRTRRLWLPGIAMIVASAAVLLILKRIVYPVYFAHVRIGPPGYVGSHNWILMRFLAYREASLLAYVFWLLLLPFLSAAGAWWSHRAGSGRVLQVATALFPLILFVTAFAGVLGGEATAPFTFTDVFWPPHVFPMIGQFGDLLLSWVVIPGAALTLGVLPFLCADSVALRRAG